MWVFESALGECFDGGAAEAGGGGELLCVDGVRVSGFGEVEVGRDGVVWLSCWFVEALNSTLRIKLVTCLEGYLE